MFAIFEQVSPCGICGEFNEADQEIVVCSRCVEINGIRFVGACCWAAITAETRETGLEFLSKSGIEIPDDAQTVAVRLAKCAIHAKTWEEALKTVTGVYSITEASQVIRQGIQVFLAKKIY